MDTTISIFIVFLIVVSPLIVRILANIAAGGLVDYLTKYLNKKDGQ